jgi:hypothetical protein
MNPKPFRIIPVAEWKARPPKSAIALVSKKPVRSIFHHSAGHVPNLSAGETYAEACAYARSIQNYHMDSNGWVDSGHNFLVTRGGFILEGRHRSIEQVRKGQMVVSAHCPGQNEQPGIEIEHIDPEKMTLIQREAAVWLFAWIARSCAFPGKSIDGHRDHFATACPGSLYGQLPQFRIDVATALKPPVPIAHSYEIHLTGETGHTETLKARKSLMLLVDGKPRHLFDEKIVSFNGVRLEQG